MYRKEERRRGDLSLMWEESVKLDRFLIIKLVRCIMCFVYFLLSWDWLKNNNKKIYIFLGNCVSFCF